MNSSIFIYSILSFIILILCAIFSYKLNLIDIPTKRKIHTKPTIYTGGIAISIAWVLSIIILDIPDNTLNNILSIGFLISIIGLIDDRYDLNVGGKLSLQIIPIFYLIIFQNLALDHLGNYIYFKLELGTFKIVFTLISVLFLINSFNYFDGLDGTLSFSTISVLSILFFLIPDQNVQYFLTILIIPLCIFLLFNFSILNLPKMFLGDSGSLLIGFVISFLLIYLANKDFAHPILLSWSVAIFVYEFLSINLIRLKNKKDVFKAGKDHLHHLIFAKSKSIFLTNFIMFSANIFLFTIGYLSFLFIGSITSLAVFILCFIIFFILRRDYLK
jgi:UDP-GlcNAc:undecaprenyl-phosphate GlcNAc-1-phosphate transferase